jgi:hypothetical protein
MPMAAASEMISRLQPKDCSSGRISTPGVERSPADTSSDRKMTPTTTKA